MRLTKERIRETLKNLIGFTSHFTRLSMPFVFLFAYIPAATFVVEPSPTTDDVPNRDVQKTISTAMASSWNLSQGSDDEIVCDLYLKHDQWLGFNDVSNSCGVESWKEWVGTPALSDWTPGTVSTEYQASFLSYIDQVSSEPVGLAAVPGIQVKLSPVNCTVGEWCILRPQVELTANDLARGFDIRSVHFKVGTREKFFDGDTARYNLPLTSQDGNWLEYWAVSTKGDSSKHILLKYRSFKSPDGDSFHFDLLGEDWKESLPSGSLSWGIFPPVDGSMPAALIQAQFLDELKTAYSYLYLSGYLIQSGQVDASACSDGGLYLDGSASPCGEEFALPQTIAWQNQFDDQILRAALKYKVPAHLLKAMIAQESQFWPDTKKPYEKGLGFITENGVDMLLNWNIPYFLNICQPLYKVGICSYGYSSIQEIRQVMLRKVVLDKIGGPEEIDILAAMLLASADQSGRIVQNLSKDEIGNVAVYVDMWKIATGNYFAGSGCMGDAIELVIKNDSPITWDNIVDQLSPVCSPAGMYVRQIFDKADRTE